MALTLDSTLATAQDSQSRQPICKITSTALQGDIPFGGTQLTEGGSEFGPGLITHSTGRLCLAYLTGNKIRYTYTDTDRTTFNTVEFDLGGSHPLEHVAVCELTDNKIGLHT